MLLSDDKETAKKCITAGKLPKILDRDDISIEIFKRREAGSSIYLDKESGKIVSYKEVKEQGGFERKQADIKREEPIQNYFERDIEKDTVICPMGETLFYAGPGSPNGKSDYNIRRYHRASACKKCKNKCTTGKRRVISFKNGEIKKSETFYDKCKEGKISRRVNYNFKKLDISKEDSKFNEWVIIKYYPNQQHLRKRNTIVEHPYGTVKRWHGGSFLLTKGKIKAAAEMGLSFLAYNFRRVIKILGTTEIMDIIRA